MPAIDIPALIDEHPVSPFQVQLLILLGLIVLLDGFDVQAMGYIAPAVVQEWGIDRAALGPVFGAGLLGMLIGSLTLSVLADRIGRRPVLISATLFFAVGMLATSRVTTLEQFRLLRLITGLGLGAIMPNVVALAGEYSPRRHRVTLMMLVSCGFTGGAVLGGLLTALLIPSWGWRSVFVVGGIVPLVLAAAMVVVLPESLQFLVLRRRQLDRVGRWLREMVPAVRLDDGMEFIVHEENAAKAPVVELFRGGRGVITVLLWTVAFIDLLMLYFLSNWLPTLARDAGMSTSEAVLLGTTLQLGGVAGTLAMGPLIDRVGFHRVLAPLFLVAAGAVALIGWPGLSPAILFPVAAVAGGTIVGGAPALNALAAVTYPTTLRSTGIGWNLGIGRIGAIVGPVVGGLLLTLGWSQHSLFLVIAAPALLAAVLVAVMGRRPTIRRHTFETIRPEHP